MYKLASSSISKAVTRSRSSASAAEHLARAIAHHRAGRLLQAESLYRQVLDTHPAHPEALHLLGLLEHQAGRYPEACALIERAICYAPASPLYWANLCSVWHARGRHDLAERSALEALKLDRAHVDALVRLGVLKYEQGKVDEAQEFLQQAVRAHPRHPNAVFQFARVLHLAHRVEEALRHYAVAAELSPSNHEVHNDYGFALIDAGRLEEAENRLRLAIRLQPAYPEAHYNLGIALKGLGRRDEAMDSHRQALRIRPHYPDALNNLGNLLREAGRIDEALECYTRATQLDPHHAKAQLAESMTRLESGDFEGGWAKYDWRFSVVKNLRHEFGKPLWDGGDITGKTVLLTWEQGFGDTLQFLRYAPLVAARGATVLLLVREPMRRLAATVEGVSAVAASVEDLPPFDLSCPLLSLPQRFGTCLDTVPAVVPYLHALPKEVAAWSECLQQDGADGSLRVGLVWAGNPKMEIDDRRSMSLSQLLPLSQVGGVRFYSLQKDGAAEQVSALSPIWPIVDHTDHLADFADTAALIMNLDLIISVDTAVAHLAGALGKPVWLLNRFDTCWRWMRERTDSPWYPTMRLFRQDRAGEWGGVIDAVLTHLRQFAATRASMLTSAALPPAPVRGSIHTVA